jgi:hypothetical protein
MLKNLFVCEVRIKILRLLLLSPEKSLHVRAIVRFVGAEINAVRRELDNLVSINLLQRRQSSNRIYYTVNTLHPYYSDLIGLLAKEDGLSYAIINKAKELGNVDFAILSKAFLRGRASSALDIDLFLVGDVHADVLEKIVKTEEDRLGREINYAVMTSDEFKARKRTNDPFIYRVLTQSRLLLIGDEEKFCSTAA